MSQLKFLFLTLILICSLFSTAYAKKRVLLIGINCYPNLKPNFWLQGCVNDVTFMYDFLTLQEKVSPSDIDSIRDLHATRSNLLKALDKLANETMAGDTVFIEFSGHGSQVLDVSGQEPDGMDETLLPCDYKNTSSLDARKSSITDKEFKTYLKRISDKSANLTVVLDACHAGGAASLAADAQITTRSMDAVLSKADQVALALFLKMHKNAPPEDTAYPFIVIAACKPDEYANESPSTDQRVFGALTFSLITQWGSSPGAKWPAIKAKVEKDLSAAFGDQTPQWLGRNIEQFPFVNQ